MTSKSTNASSKNMVCHIKKIPDHLLQYIAEQDYSQYTPIDQAVWRYVMRTGGHFFKKHAPAIYNEGVIKTGMSIETIPDLKTMDRCLAEFDWCAVGVRGFIPPLAYIEFQSMGILPIAPDMRTLEHLEYTPTPDIIHEAAGHAPILYDADFREFVKQNALIARKAIVSIEDVKIYEAIRVLSDLKENPASTPVQIKQAEANLNAVLKAKTHASEATLAARLYWWTAEYGLVGTQVNNLKIYGAGLLSSVGESYDSTSPQVKKLPLTLDCLEVDYDITQPQPQLFYTPDFKHLVKVLKQFSETLSFVKGGRHGLNQAIQSRWINTIEFENGLQISGQVIEYLVAEGPEEVLPNPQEMAFIKFTGPTQISYRNKVLVGQDTNYHAHGFSSPLGPLKQQPSLKLATASKADLTQFNLIKGQTTTLEFTSGFILKGTLKNIHQQDGQNLIFTFEQCQITLGNKVYYKPDWGNFDLIAAHRVVSVYNGAVDSKSFPDAGFYPDISYPAKKTTLTEQNKLLNTYYQQLRTLREAGKPQPESNKQAFLSAAQITQIKSILTQTLQAYPSDWLLSLEVLELLKTRMIPVVEELTARDVEKIALGQLKKVATQKANVAVLIKRGCEVFGFKHEF